MKGSHEIIIQNRRLRYKITVNRNITILRGNSATGKTTLIEMVDEYSKDGPESGIQLRCDKRCVVLSRGNWERDLQDYHDSIVFIDEGNGFVKSIAFAESVKQSDNYFVIATRDSLFNLPYSIDEIYGIKNTSGNRYQGTKRIYSELYRIYNPDAFQGKPDKIIVEDSNSAYEFWRAICAKEGIVCETAKGKSNLFGLVQKSEENRILAIADGAAFGPEMERAMSLKNVKNVVYFLPESFEWLILRSGLVESAELGEILAHPADFIESKKYISWERFFTALLIEHTRAERLSIHKKEQAKSLPLPVI